MKLFRILAVTALALFLPFAATACGDDSTGDLSVGEMSKELQSKGGLDKATADCLAKALKDADFTKAELEKLGTGDIDAKKEKAYTDAGIKCIMGSSSIPATAVS